VSIRKTHFGFTPVGLPAEIFFLENRYGLKIELLSFGATLRRVILPAPSGKDVAITLCRDSLEQYADTPCYFGSTIGRVCNRIASGRFNLEGADYQLAKNDHDTHHLHGGDLGFDRRDWSAEAIEGQGYDQVQFSRISPQGEEGYPGTLQVQVTYTLSDDNSLQIDYRATCDQATPVNLTNHAFWNLAGPDQSILDHELRLYADAFLPVDDQLIPTGRRSEVKGTPMDFSQPQVIGERIAEVSGGYDHCYVLAPPAGELRPAAVLVDPASGRSMSISTTAPGIQFYSGNFLDGCVGSGERMYQRHGALCLETQGFPNAVNEPNFPSVVLLPNETYRQTTAHNFRP